MARWDYQVGDLLREELDGALHEVVREQYTKRYMDSQDHDMAAHGMGHLAGSWCGAIDVISTHDGRVRTLKTRDARNRMKNLTAAGEISDIV